MSPLIRDRRGKHRNAMHRSSVDATTLAERKAAMEKGFPLGYSLPEESPPRSGGQGRDRWEWKSAHPKQHEWLRNSAHRNAFASSVIEGVHCFGQPTPAQQAALDRIAPEDKGDE